MTAEDNKALIGNYKTEACMSANEKVKYVVQNKGGKTGEGLKKPQVYIKGKAYKAGEIVVLDPKSFDAKSLIGSGWILPASEVEEKSGAKK
jgi:hypothetical protein